MTCVSAFFSWRLIYLFGFTFWACLSSNVVADYPILFWIVQIIGCKEIKFIRFFFIIFLFFLDAILIFFSRSFPFSFQMFLTMSAEMRFIPDFRKAHKSVLRGQLEKKRPRCSNRALFTEMSRDRNHIITELPRFRALQEENKGHVGQNTEHGERPGQPDSATPPRPPGCRRMCSSCCMHPTGCLSSREHP